MKKSLRSKLSSSTSAVALLAVGIAIGVSTASTVNAADGFTESATDLTWQTDAANDDLWDIDTNQGAAGVNVTLDALAGDDTLTITSGAGTQSTGQFNTIGYADSNDGGSANTIVVVIGDGTQDITLTANGNIDLVSDDDVSNAIIIDADDDGAGAGAVAQLTAKGDIDVGATGTITLDTDSTASANVATLLLNGTSTQSITGLIDGAVATEGLVQNSNTGGWVIFNNAIGSTATINDIILDGSTRTRFSSTVDISDLMSIGANAVVEVDGALTIGGKLTIADGATIFIEANFGAGDTVFTMTNGALDLTDDDGSADVTLVMPANFTSGNMDVFDDTATDISALTDEFTVNNTALASYTIVQGDDNTEIRVTATKNSVATIASTLGSTQSAASALDAAVAATSSDSTIADAYTVALSAGGATALKAAEQSEPTQNSGAGAAMLGNSSMTMNIVSQRLAMTRLGSQTGFASGDEGTNKMIWLRPFGSVANQQERKDASGGAIDGYDADTWGIAGGFDTLVSEKIRLGVSFVYSNTGIDYDGVQNDETDIATYQGSIYGDYTAENYYIEGMVAYAYNDLETSRQINFGGLDRTAKGDYNTNQYTARIGAGFPITRGKHVFTPNAAFQYTYVDSESYSETGAGGLNLEVDPEDLNSAVATLGMKYKSSHKLKSLILTPRLRADVSYDFASDEADMVSNYTGSTTTFTTKGTEIAELGGSVGAGFTLSSADGQWDFSADYDAGIKSDYLSHTARLEIKLNF